MAYLMESKKEAKRLLMKSDQETSHKQLVLTGLKPGMTAVDAGGGAGFVTRIMSEIVGNKGVAILVDQSKERLEAAQEHNVGKTNIHFIPSDLEKIQLESNSVDYVFSRFVFEYLENPETVMQEFVRIAKPGGKIVVGDLDYNVLSHYPLAPHLEAQLLEIVRELQSKKLWDPYMGRKLYSFFNDANLTKIKVHMIPHHLIYGEADARDIENWKMKIDQIEKLVAAGVIKLSFKIKIFKSEFMTFFKNPGRFSYSPLFLVEGVKPNQ